MNKLPNHLKAMMLGVAASTAYSFAYVLVRLLGAGRLHAFEIAFFRTLVCFLAIVAISRRISGGGFRTQRRFTIVARGALSAAGLLLWFYGLVHLPLAEAITLSLTTVCFASLGAAMFLGEPISGLKGVAIALAIAGAAVIVRPGFGSFKPEYFAVLGAAACWGAAACLVRSAARTEHPLTIVLWTTMLITIFTFPTAVAVWRWPTGLDCLALIAIGLLSAVGMVAWTTAFKYGEATQVTITDFVQIAWGVLIGLAFGEFPSRASLLGIGLIFGSVLIISATPNSRNAPRQR